MNWYLKYINPEAPLAEAQSYFNKLSTIYNIPITPLNTYVWGKQLSKLTVFVSIYKYNKNCGRMVNHWKLNHYTKK